MSIEFNCPYCTATIRVPDDAAGKTGTCPKCDTRIRVPVVDLPQGVSPSAPAGLGTSPPVAIPSRSEQNSIVPPAFPAGAGGSGTAPSHDILPVIQDNPTSGATVKYLRERRKRKTGGWNRLLWPAVLASILIMAVVVYQRMDRASYECDLSGTRLDPQKSLTAQLTPGKLKVAQPFWSELLEALRASPVDLRGNLLMIHFDGDENALSVSLRAGPEADFIRVPAFENEKIARFAAETQDMLDDRRLQEMQLACDGMASDWRVGAGSPADLLSEFRDQLALGAHRRGFGRICEAVVKDGRYPCIHEDEQGGLVFLVPRGTSRFEVRERGDLAEGACFPSRLLIRVNVGDRSTPAE